MKPSLRQAITSGDRTKALNLIVHGKEVKSLGIFHTGTYEPVGLFDDWVIGNGGNIIHALYAHGGKGLVEFIVPSLFRNIAKIQAREGTVDLSRFLLREDNDGVLAIMHLGSGREFILGLKIGALVMPMMMELKGKSSDALHYKDAFGALAKIYWDYCAPESIQYLTLLPRVQGVRDVDDGMYSQFKDFLWDNFTIVLDNGEYKWIVTNTGVVTAGIADLKAQIERAQIERAGVDALAAIHDAPPPPALALTAANALVTGIYAAQDHPGAKREVSIDEFVSHIFKQRISPAVPEAISKQGVELEDAGDVFKLMLYSKVVAGSGSYLDTLLTKGAPILNAVSVPTSGQVLNHYLRTHSEIMVNVTVPKASKEIDLWEFSVCFGFDAEILKTVLDIFKTHKSGFQYSDMLKVAVHYYKKGAFDVVIQQDDLLSIPIAYSLHLLRSIRDLEIPKDGLSAAQNKAAKAEAAGLASWITPELVARISFAADHKVIAKVSGYCGQILGYDPALGRTMSLITDRLPDIPDTSSTVISTWSEVTAFSRVVASSGGEHKAFEVAHVGEATVVDE